MYDETSQRAIDTAEAALRTALDHVDEHEQLHGAEPTDPGQAERRKRLLRAAEKAGEAFDAAQTRAEKVEKVREAAKNPANAEAGFHAPNVNTRTGNPWAELSARFTSVHDLAARAQTALEQTPGIVSDGGDRIANLLEREPVAAEMVLARSNPAYRSAFDKVIKSPERAHHTFSAAEAEAFDAVEAARSSLSTNVATGGYLMPLSYDPSAIIANNGSANPFRQIARVEHTASTPYRAVTTAGSSAAWLAENTATSDASPTFGKVDIPLYKALQWITASYEISLDGALLAQNIANVAADARDTLEASAFATGAGSTEPYGVVTRVAATTASRVASTTATSFTTASVVDVFKVFDALPARARQSKKIAWVANNGIFSLIRQMSPAANGGSFWTDLGNETPQRLLGAQRFESSAMTTATTSGSSVLLIGDFEKYLIVDHIAGPSFEYVQNAVDGSGLPTGTRGWIYWNRTGADVVDATQFRVLQT